LLVAFRAVSAPFVAVRQERLFASPPTQSERGSKRVEVARGHDIMTAAEVAEYLRVPLKSLYTWRYTHDGPPSARVGKYLRYRRTEVDEWLTAQTRFSRVDALELRAVPKP
jgi:excisionase family DNA binding protein